MEKINKNKKTLYSQFVFSPGRRETREVMVGDVGVGKQNPIRVQSMTISDTKNTEAVVAETKELVEVGCEIVRVTAPTIHHAENLRNIRDRLHQENIRVPLVADIHFTPQAAMVAADYVEKVRINPGNYADRKLFAVKEYTDAEYESELQRMAEKFIPLVKKCQHNGVAMRIGTNHGSLSDRIMNRYGDTPEGMVESALEFVRICESEGYQDVIFSMKASSPFIMVAAYRLLAQRMNELGMDYPFHLGVTEAGEGEDGRIKSAIGIGSLLEDGIGDTIRVSLTEDSVHEIPVAKALVRKFNQRAADLKAVTSISEALAWNPLERSRRESQKVSSSQFLVGSKAPYGIISTYDISSEEENSHQLEQYFEQHRDDENFPDLLVLKGFRSLDQAEELVKTLHKYRPKLKTGIYLPYGAHLESWVSAFDLCVFPVESDTEDLEIKEVSRLASQKKKILDLRFKSLEGVKKRILLLKSVAPALISLATKDSLHGYRGLVQELNRHQIKFPLHLYFDAHADTELVLEAASILGGILADGLGDSIEVAGLSVGESARLCFNILQACRLRISKAEFIACPSCGRTLFDLQETTQRIKKKTAHLKGVKIAIMGCIVNGPGEMADADFGYVGGGPGKIHLYVGKECVEKNIPTAQADEKLIELIKKYDRWVDPAA